MRYSIATILVSTALLACDSSEVDTFETELATCESLGSGVTMAAQAGTDLGLAHYLTYTDGVENSCIVAVNDALEAVMVLREHRASDASMITSITTVNRHAEWASWLASNGVQSEKSGDLELRHAPVAVAIATDVSGLGVVDSPAVPDDGQDTYFAACTGSYMSVLSSALGTATSCNLVPGYSQVRSAISAAKWAIKVWEVVTAKDRTQALMNKIKGHVEGRIVDALLDNLAEGTLLGCMNDLVGFIQALTALETCIRQHNSPTANVCGTHEAQHTAGVCAGGACCYIRCTSTRCYQDCFCKFSNHCPYKNGYTTPRACYNDGVCRPGGDDEDGDEDFCNNPGGGGGGDGGSDLPTICTDCSCYNSGSGYLWEGTVCGSTADELVGACWNKC